MKVSIKFAGRKAYEYLIHNLDLNAQKIVNVKKALPLGCFTKYQHLLDEFIAQTISPSSNQIIIQ